MTTPGVVHLQHLHRDGPTCVKTAESFFVVEPGTYVSEDVDEVTCEDCLVAAIKDAGPIAVQAYVIRLGELSLQRNHPSVYLELEGLGQVSKVNAEIRAELAAAREADQGVAARLDRDSTSGFYEPDVDVDNEPVSYGITQEVSLDGWEAWCAERGLDANPEAMRQWLSERTGTEVTMHEYVSPQKMGKSPTSSMVGPSLSMPDRLSEEVLARLAGFIWRHGEDEGDFEGRECALQRRGGWAIIREASAIGLTAKGFCALDHKIPEEKLRELGGYIDPPQDPVCTCGAIEVNSAAKHLRPCPLSFEWGLCPRCQRPIALASFTELGFYEPDVDVDNDPVVWRHVYSGYGACGDMRGFASDPNAPLAYAGSQPGREVPPEKPKYGHDREGHDCAPEICGGSRLDPCAYGPEDIARFEAEAAGEIAEWRRTTEKFYEPGVDEPITATGEPVRSVRGMHPRLIEHDEVHDAEVVASMPGTGPCPCGGQYDAFGKCTSCGKVD